MVRLIARALVLVTLAPASFAQGPPDPLALERLVRQDCGSCHGMTLKGGLGPDLLRGRLTGREPGTIARIILDGVQGTPMPPWRPLLSEAEALWIANYLLDGTAP
jgi:cytochrome c55X